jgi:CMP-2-keto-3-deoxyoctulosonic acid synthetase
MEEAESIEMLRAIESGRTVRLVDSKYQTRSVDTEADLADVERIMADDPVLALYAGRQ